MDWLLRIIYLCTGVTTTLVAIAIVLYVRSNDKEPIESFASRIGENPVEIGLKMAFLGLFAAGLNLNCVLLVQAAFVHVATERLFFLFYLATSGGFFGSVGLMLVLMWLRVRTQELASELASE